MIRKQFHITRLQDLALKRRARSLGISEAEVVRQALDRALGEEISRPLSPDRRALEKLLAESRRIAGGRRVTGGRFDRAEVYEERETRRMA